MPTQIQTVLRFLKIPLYRPKILAIMTCIPALFALLYGILVPPPFRSTAVVALIRTRNEVTFDERFTTITGEDPITNARNAPSIQDRATELSQLVKNGAIAKEVIIKLKDTVPQNEDPRGLMGKISTTIMSPGGMIAITAVDPDPEQAALLANTWASSYELYVNTLYSGAATGYSQSVQTELARARTNYDTAQKALEDFLPTSKIGSLGREIGGNQTLLNLLTQNQTTAISSTIEKQLQAQTQIINSYMSAQVSNQLLAFNTQQEAKRQLLSQFIDAEMQARMSAIKYDRDMRQRAFSTAAEADSDNKMAVIQQEASTKREALAQAYAEQTRLTKLLGNAQTMRDHVNEGGDSAASSNTLALLLLKTQIFAGQGTDENDKLSNLPGNLQIQTSGTTPETAAGQLRDIDAVIVAIESRIEQLNTEIQTRSNELLAGTGYNFLSEFSANTNTVPVTTTPILSSTLAVSIPLTTAISQRYNELFDVGDLTLAADQPSDATPLFAQIKSLYPDLFSFDAIAELTQGITIDNPLYKAAIERTQELLELKDLQALPITAQNDAINASFASLQNEINTLQSELEAQNSQLENLTQARDIARETFTTLSKKQEEVNIASAITGSEVRLAIPAMTANQRTQSRLITVIIAGILGFLFGVVVAYMLHFIMGNAPLPVAEGKRKSPLSRVFSWLVAPTQWPFQWFERINNQRPPQGGHSATR